MVSPFIQVTVVAIVKGSTADIGPRLLGTRHIVSISSGPRGTGWIVLDNGETLNVKESYDHLLRILGL